MHTKIAIRYVHDLSNFLLKRIENVINFEVVINFNCIYL